MCKANPAILTEQAWSIKDLFLLANYRGFDSQRFVLLLFSILPVGRPLRDFLAYPSQRPLRQR